MIGRLASLLITLLVAHASCGNLWAQTSTSMLDSIHMMQEVSVEARPYQEVIPSQKLAGKKLEQLNAHNVADALRFFSGVKLKDYGGMGGMKTVDVRNMGSHHVGIFYDGIQLGNATNGTVDLGKYSLDDIEEISLYNGQKSEIFQAAKDYSSASSIYIRTKRPKFATEKNTNVLARYKFGSIHLINPSLRIEQKLSKTFTAALSATYTHSDGEYKYKYKKIQQATGLGYDTTATRHNSDIKAYRIEGTALGAVANGFLETKLYYYQSHRGLPGPIVNNVVSFGDRIKDKNFFAQSSYTKQISKKHKLKAQAKYAFDYSHYAPQEGNRWENYYQQTVYVSIINMYTLFPWWDISLSADYEWNKLNATKNENTLIFPYPTRNSMYIALANGINWGKIKGQATLVATQMNDNTRSGSGLPNQSELTPAVFVGYQPFTNHDFTIRAFYKRIFRLPTFNELYYGASMEAKIKPEYTNQYNIGVSYNKAINNRFLKAINMQIDGYILNITNKIVTLPRSGIRWTVTNYGKVESKGIDAKIGVVTQVAEINITLDANYTYSDAKDMSDKRLSSYKQQIAYTPKHSGSITLHADYAGWGVNYNYGYIDKRYTVNNNTASYQMNKYTMHDASAYKTIIGRKYKLKMGIEINNIANNMYEIVNRYPMPGREFQLVTNIEF